MQTILDTLLSPAILFFVLGSLAGYARSDLTIPEQVGKGLSLYLMAAIGIKGGVSVAAAGADPAMLRTAIAGGLLSFGLPFLAFALLRTAGRLPRVDAGGISAFYGSVSVVTFVTGVAVVSEQGIGPAGWMVAVMAIMETPGILAGLLLARGNLRSLPRAPNPEGIGQHSIWREVLLNGPVVVLVGSFGIGLVTGPQGFVQVSPFFDGMFRGVLCLFLLEMGLRAATRLREARALTPNLAVLAIVIPLLNAAIGFAAAAVLGLDADTATVFMLLCASASYIAAPAAIQLAAPEADVGLGLAMSLAITFPFNIILGIPLYSFVAHQLL
ncbi:MAG: sodium-dependent bicarbonate transport family permease [Sphingomonadaceae bacterium]